MGRSLRPKASGYLIIFCPVQILRTPKKDRPDCLGSAGQCRGVDRWCVCVHTYLRLSLIEALHPTHPRTLIFLHTLKISRHGGSRSSQSQWGSSRSQQPRTTATNGPVVPTGKATHQLCQGIWCESYDDQYGWVSTAEEQQHCRARDVLRQVLGGPRSRIDDSFDGFAGRKEGRILQ